MAFGDRLTLVCLIDGQIQAEINNVSVNGESGAQDVRTLLQGLVGKTKGSGSLEISGTWSLPLGGPEFDVFTAGAEGSYHELQIPIGKKSLITNGWITTFGASQSVDANTEVTATFRGPLTKPE